MQNVTEKLELETVIKRVLIGPDNRNEKDEDLDDYYEDEDEDEDEEWGNTF